MTSLSRLRQQKVFCAAPGCTTQWSVLKLCVQGLKLTEVLIESLFFVLFDQYEAGKLIIHLA